MLENLIELLKTTTFGRNNVCLDKMLEIKSLFDSETITIVKSKNITKVANDLGLNESQKAKFYKLFSSTFECSLCPLMSIN